MLQTQFRSIVLTTAVIIQHGQQTLCYAPNSSPHPWYFIFLLSEIFTFKLLHCIFWVVTFVSLCLRDIPYSFMNNYHYLCMGKKKKRKKKTSMNLHLNWKLNLNLELLVCYFEDSESDEPILIASSARLVDSLKIKEKNVLWVW